MVGGPNTCGYSCYCGVTPANTVIPDTSGLPIPGQFNVPGGIASNGAINVACGSGVNGVYQCSDVNPNPTGCWMPLAQSVINAAQRAYSSFEKGSPAPATPTAQRGVTPTGGPGFTLNNRGFDVNLPFSGQTLLLIGLGVVALVLIAK